MALQKCKSLRQFENNAEKEAELISLRMKEYIGSGFRPCEPYISHLFNKILTTQETPDPDDILDCGGSCFVQITIKKIDNIFKTIEYIVLPEVFTEFIMAKKNLSYNAASQFLHGKETSKSKFVNGFCRWHSLAS